MLNLLSYLSKREGMTNEEFVDYYENHHVPLILSLTAPPTLCTSATTCDAVTVSISVRAQSISTS